MTAASKKFQNNFRKLVYNRSRRLTILNEAEATAIAIAILTIPSNSRVTIHIDSQACIDTYNKLSKPSPKQMHKRWLKKRTGYYGL